MEYKPNKYYYGDVITWYGVYFEVVQVGTVILKKNGQKCPLLYTVQVNYPYQIKIFYENKYLYEITNPQIYQDMIKGFQNAILNNPNIKKEHKIFAAKERLRYEKQALKDNRQLFAQSLKKLETKGKEELQLLATQLNYLKAYKEDPFRYPPLNLNNERLAEEYWQLLINNKDKWSLTPEEKQDNDWLKDVSYNPIEIKNDNKKK